MKTRTLAAGVVVLLSLIAGTWVSANAAGPYLVMKIEGPEGLVKGECQLIDHVGWIDLKTFGQAVRNDTGLNPDVGFFSVTKSIDISSVELAYHAAVGTVFKSISFEMLSVHNSGPPKVDYSVEMLNPRIIFILPEQTGNGEKETVAIDGFTQITWTYNRYNATGSKVGTRSRSVPGY
jgi:type VI protein secretion system component Hcp